MRVAPGRGQGFTGACLALALLAGCTSQVGQSAATSAGPVGGALVGIGLGGVTANPFIAYAAGVGAQAGITALEKYLYRRLHHGEQERIAGIVGGLAPGQSAPWRIGYTIPLENEHGDVTVIAQNRNALTMCKQVAFTVLTKSAQAIYITTACRQPDGSWGWAQAEPATDRWGALQ